MFFKTGVLKNFESFSQENTCVGGCLFKEVAVLDLKRDANTKQMFFLFLQTPQVN